MDIGEIRAKRQEYLEEAVKKVSEKFKKQSEERVIDMHKSGGTDKPRIGTPNAVEVLMHCHCTPEPHPRTNAPAVEECLDNFLEWGVIERRKDLEENVFKTTDLGAAWVKAICNTKMPRQSFIDENGRQL